MKTVRTLQDKQLALALIGKLFEYPTDDYKAAVDAALRFMTRHFNRQSKPLKEFQKLIDGKELWELEELFTRTFDLAPLCCPYISAHLYGDESYDRGGFMSKLNQRYEEAEFELHGEMPDHLGIILKFAPNLSSEELDELIHFCLIKPVGEMTANLKDSDAPFYHLLETVNKMLPVDLPGEVVL